MSLKKGKTIGAKVTDEMYEKIKKYAADNNLTVSEVLNTGFSKIFEGGNDDTASIQQITELKNKLEAKENEIEKLKEQLNNQPSPDNSQIEALNNQVEELLKANEALTLEVEELRNREPIVKEVIKEVEIPRKQGKNEIVIAVPPSLDPFLTEVANRETNRTGKKITKAMVLINLFWAQVSKGPGDHLPIVFKQSEIKRILENVKREQEQKENK